MIFPRVKHECVSDKYTKFESTVTVSAGEHTSDACRLLELFIPAIKAIAASGEATVNAIADCRGTTAKEGYKLSVKDGSVKIEYATYAGIRNALSALCMIIKERDGGILIPDCEIEDAPGAEHRGLMLDNARGVMPIERFKSDMVLAAKAKMNILHLHLADSKGISIEMDTLPEEYRLQGYYSKKEVQDIRELARVLGLEIIPEFDMPAHSTMLNKLFPTIRCDTDIEEPSLWTVCAGSEDAYALYEKIIAEFCEIFPTERYLHIGGDEIEFLDLLENGKKAYVCHWLDCRRCRKKMADEGLKDRSDLHYYFVNRINGYVKSHGKRAIMWSDQIDCNKPKGIDDDILMHFWRIAGRGRGPHDGCSMQKQLDYGYEMINSYYPNTYVDLEDYMDPSNLSHWMWNETPEVREENRRQILGGETCAWEYGNLAQYSHYAHSLPSAIMLMGDKFWSSDKIEYTPAHEAALTRAVLGAKIPDGFNVFAAIGSIFPPRNDKLCYPEKIMIGRDQLKQVLDILSDDALFEGADSDRAKAYSKCVEDAISKL